ncbi:hypothetical protein JJQ59_03465 [Cupriavidus necator]|uniref:hypothetical protein n=1 Tax=Cupriavidus necator TaxID=106590 RepID=UPI0011BF8DE8|nr:hypothetical protein [Cupriavidus necator]QQX85033.1 hypothetical protein JJQ59_03465 [Cupriavidus necator]
MPRNLSRHDRTLKRPLYSADASDAAPNHGEPPPQINVCVTVVSACKHQCALNNQYAMDLCFFLQIDWRLRHIIGFQQIRVPDIQYVQKVADRLEMKEITNL